MADSHTSSWWLSRGFCDCDVSLWCFSKVEHIGAEEGFGENIEIPVEAGQKPQKRRE
jgi:hypothetical protein